MLMLLLARQGDTTALRSVMAQLPPATGVDTADAMDLFVRWRVARALGDARELTRIRDGLQDAPSSTLRRTNRRTAPIRSLYGRARVDVRGKGARNAARRASRSFSRAAMHRSG